MVDFGGLDDLKNLLQKQFDHTLCVAADDPLLEGFKSLHTAGGCDLRIMEGGVGIEKTAEWCLNAADAYCRNITNGRCWVEKVEAWENEKNSAVVTAVNTNIAPQTVSDTVATTMQSQPPINHVQNFMADIAQETGINLETVIKNPPANTGPRPVQVGNKVTSGFSNLFAGTSWGK